MTIATFLFFTALVGAITWFLTRKDDHGTSTGYFLAGRTLTGGFIAGSLLLTNLSTEQLVGLNGAAFTDGIAVMCWEVVAGASLVIMALYFLPKYLRSGIATIPEFLENRFNGVTRGMTSGIFIVAYAAILLPMVLYTGALGLMGILDLNGLLGIESRTTVLWITVWFIGIVGSIYAIFGGLRTVAVSDTINGFGLLVGGILITMFALNAVSDDGGVFKGLSTLKEAHPDKFNSIGGSDSSVPFSTLFTGVLLLNLFYWTTNQQIIQRTFGASSLKEGQKGVLIAGVFKVLAPLILVLPGIIAFHMFADRADFKADMAYGTLVQEVLPWYLKGFFAAVMVGAILSSFNSALNSTATLFSLGVYKKFVKHGNVDERSVINNGKIVGAIVAVLAMCTAPLLENVGSIFGYLQDMNALYFIPIFAIILAGLLLPRANSAAANIALVAGLLMLSLGYWVKPFSTWAAMIPKFHFMGVVFAALMIFQIVMSLVAPRSEAWKHEHSGDVDLTPWKWAKPVGIGIVVFVVALYLSLADFSVLKAG